MNESSAIYDPNRLPWLEDTHVRPRPKPPGPMLLVVGTLIAVILAAGISFWLGQRAGDVAKPTLPASVADRPSTTIQLPEAVGPTNALAGAETTLPDAQPQAQPNAVAEPAPATIEPAPPPPIRRAMQPAKPARHKAARAPVPRASARTTPQPPRPAARPAVRAAPPAPRVYRPPAPRVYHWPSAAEAVGLRRVIRLDAFWSPPATDRGLAKLQQAYPQLRGLPIVTVANTDDWGHVYYRVHLITTSPEQSKWLCDRLHRDRRQCTVLG
jgi:hypothetical protein